MPELLEELQPYVQETRLGTWVKHPLVFCPAVAAEAANAVYEQKKEQLAAAAKKEDWHRVVFLYERPYRVLALVTHVVGTDDWSGRPRQLVQVSQEVRDLAATVWADSESQREDRERWEAMFAGWAPGDSLLLRETQSDADWGRWGALPDKFTAYRAGVEDGWSWSLDPETARFFGSRFGRDYQIREARISKGRVFGYLTGRGEQELLVLPDVRP